MKRIFCSAAILWLGATAVVAAEPTPLGDWLVKNGYGIIRIDNCNGKMWGIIAWEKKAGTDSENPEPAKKGRPSLGVPILLGMAPTKPNRWEGQIYNTENGKTYSGSIAVESETKLQLEGCLFPNFLCGGQDWTRVTSLPTDGVSLPPKAVPQVKGPPPVAKKGAPAAAVTSDVCTRIAADEAALAAKAATKK
jgi:uncharacterized protein (DUF2147 family)